jgi:CRISPR/Cas system-associated protein Cas10 (large subunit of type III CRISPR-Cas system)
MTTTKDSSDFIDGRCPVCGVQGDWNFISRRMECRTCNTSGAGYSLAGAVTEHHEKTETKREDQVTETYQERMPDGQLFKITVVSDVPKLEEFLKPKLSFSERLGLFHRNRSKPLFNQEKRWGRDHLRKLADNDYGYDVLVEAHLVAQRQWKKPLEAEPEYKETDLQDMMDSLTEFFRQRDTRDEISPI